MSLSRVWRSTSREANTIHSQLYSWISNVYVHMSVVQDSIKRLELLSYYPQFYRVNRAYLTFLAHCSWVLGRQGNVFCFFFLATFDFGMPMFMSSFDGEITLLCSCHTNVARKKTTTVRVFTTSKTIMDTARLNQVGSIAKIRMVHFILLGPSIQKKFGDVAQRGFCNMLQMIPFFRVLHATSPNFV